MADWLRYSNQNAIRNQPLSGELTRAMSFLEDMGVEMEVFSGGQTGSRRTGSHRHDDGGAGDVYFYKDGKRLDWADPKDRPIFEEIVGRGRAAGLTGFGAGEGYMRPGSMHVGFGDESVWGAGGKSANAPDWLKTAYTNMATTPQAQPVSGRNPSGIFSLPQRGLNAASQGMSLLSGGASNLLNLGFGSRQPQQTRTAYAPQRPISPVVAALTRAATSNPQVRQSAVNAWLNTPLSASPGSRTMPRPHMTSAPDRILQLAMTRPDISRATKDNFDPTTGFKNTVATRADRSIPRSLIG